MKIVLFLLFAVFYVQAEYVKYDEFRVYRIVPQSKDEVDILRSLQDNHEYAFWTDIYKEGDDVRIMVGPGDHAKFEAFMIESKIDFNMVIDNVQRHIDVQLKRPVQNANKALRNFEDYKWDYFMSIDEIYDWLDKTAEDYPDVVTQVNIGTTLEGHAIRGLVIDYKKNINSTMGMIEGGIHAREWISPATVTWIIKEFLTSTNADVRAMAENVVWHIFPIVNPDGYAYTFTHNRMWRKNRNPANRVSCAPWNLSDDTSNGIDLNRNFGYLWMTIGASSNPCAETYAGPVPFSEIESIAIANYVTSIQEDGRLVFYYAFHSYSQMVLVPFSHVGGSSVWEANNYGDLYEIAIKGMDKLNARHGTMYSVGTSVDILYAVSGSSFDWAKGAANIPIVYLFELRDVGQYGFLLPPELIIPNNEEVMDGLLEMDRVSRTLGYY